MKNRKTKKGFTIVELVIVIAVIGILSAILIPTFVNLTSQAQEAAKKQQVSDAYTAYALEAIDGKYDNLYLKAYNAADTDYHGANLAITSKVQGGVALKLNSEWFIYNAEKGWESKGEEAQGTILVVKDAVAATTYATKNSESEGYQVVFAAESTSTAAQANAKLSTFNGVEVYVKTVA